MLDAGRHGIRVAVLVLALTTALAAVGCAGDGEEDGDGAQQTTAGGGEAESPAATLEIEPNAVTEAADATAAAGTARVTYEAMFQGSEGSYSFSSDGEVDHSSQQSRFDYDMSGLPGMGAENVEVRFDGPTAFVRFPGGPPDVELPEGKDWIRLPPPEAPEEQNAPTPALDLAGVQQDPTQFLRYLRTGAVDVQEEGTEDVRGEPATIYTALLDMNRVVGAGGEGLGEDEEGRAESLRAAEALREQVGDAEIPVTVHVDDEGRIVRVLLSFDLQTGTAGAVSALTTTEYFDFGTDVQVEPPPEEQVVDAADVG